MGENRVGILPDLRVVIKLEDGIKVCTLEQFKELSKKIEKGIIKDFDLTAEELHGVRWCEELRKFDKNYKGKVDYDYYR